MFKKIKYFFLSNNVFSAMLYLITRLYSATFKYDIANEEQWISLWSSSKPIIICMLHQQFFAAQRHFQSYAKFHPAIMISKSRDGDIVAGVAKLSNWRPIRGSSSRHGKEALLEMIHHLLKYQLAVQIVDGPRGPIGHFKPGAIKMAQETSGFLIPCQITCNNAWYASSWDRFMIPKPFAKIKIRFENPVTISKTISSDDFELARKQMEKLMTQFIVDPNKKADT